MEHNIRFQKQTPKFTANWFSTMVPKTHTGEKVFFSINGSGEAGYLQIEELNQISTSHQLKMWIKICFLHKYKN